MIRFGKIRDMKSIILIIAVIWITLICTAGPANAGQLACRQFMLSVKLANSLPVSSLSTLPFNSESSDSEESSSWVPRIVIPVVAIVVVGTATYLIFSQRG
jgi:hypothetical protein